MLALLSGAAWLLTQSQSAPDRENRESAFDLEEAEELPDPGSALAAGAVERSAALEEPSPSPVEGSAAELAARTSFDAPTLRGRRVDAAGQALPADQVLISEISPRRSRRALTSETTPGPFHQPLQTGEDWAQGTWICLQHQGDSKTPPDPETYVFARAVDPVTLLQDVGDLASGGPTILAGRVTDLDRRPLAGANVEIRWALPQEGGSRSVQISASGEPNEGRTVFHSITDADGRFRLLGSWPDLGKWTAQASHPEHLPATVPIAPGAANVEILLPRASKLRGRILVDPEISLERLTVKIRARRDGKSRWEQNLQLKPDLKTGEFAATNLTHGWARIRVFDNQMKWNLHFQYGIPLPSGLDAQVPELQPLDLRGRLKNFQLTALLPDGSLAQDLRIVVDEKKGRRTFGIPNPISCIVPRETIQLVLTAKGCREQKVFITGAEQTVLLEISPKIAFQLQRPPSLETDAVLQCSVNGIEGTRGNFELKFDEAGRAELELAPGQYALFAQVGLWRGRSASFSPRIPLLPSGELALEFAVGEDGSPGRVQFQIDEPALREAVAALRDAKPR